MEYESRFKRTWAEIDLDAAEHNFRLIREKTNKESKVCCVIKANAYGHGAVELAQLYEKLGADWFAVSNLEEGLQLRRAGLRLPILILGFTPPAAAKVLAEENISQCVYSLEFARLLSEQARLAGVNVKIHLKIDTGMGRIGFSHREEGETLSLEQALLAAQTENLVTEGIFTHFAVCDCGKDGEDFTRSQAKAFLSAVAFLEGRGVHFAIRHIANSAAILDHPEYHLDMVRAGVILYGLMPSELYDGKTDLVPVMQLKSCISHIKPVHPGDSVSYGRTYIFDREAFLATVPIGYADGYRRGNAPGSRLLAGNSLCPIRGRVCMDQLMIEMPDLSASIGDEVTVFGKKPAMTADEVAKVAGTIGYEIVCDVGARVPRVYLKNGKVVSCKSILFD